MSSRFNSIPFIQSLEETIRELIKPLESIQRRIYEEEGGGLPDGLDLLMGELTMVALIFTNVDLNISAEETEILNNFRQSIYGNESFALTSHDYRELCRKFLRIHPDRRMSIDYTPYSVQYLQIYDREHGTEYAEKARTMFFRLANSIVKADGLEKSEELMTLLNFKEILYSPNFINTLSERGASNSPQALATEEAKPQSTDE